MRAVGYILIFIAIVNGIALVGGLLGNAPNSFINSKITCVMAFGTTAALILYLQNRKKDTSFLKKEKNVDYNEPSESNLSPSSSDSSYSTFIVDNYLQKYKQRSRRPSIKTKSEIPIIKMIKTEGDGISFIENPKTGNMLFKCGNVKGYVYPSIQENIMNVDVNTLAMQEINIDNDEYRPTIVPLKQPISAYIVSKENLEDVKYLMTAKDLEQKEGAIIQYIKYPESERLNFYCGCVEGIVHPDLEKNYAFVSKEDILYVEYSFDGRTYSMLEYNDKSSTKRFINIKNVKSKNSSPASIEEHSNNRLESSNIKILNKMSAKSLILSENSAIDFVRNPNTGKLFFVCGSKKGYVSPKVASQIDTIELDEMQYAEVSIDGGEAVPTLMLINTPIVKRSMGFEEIETEDLS